MIHAYLLLVDAEEPNQDKFGANVAVIIEAIAGKRPAVVCIAFRDFLKITGLTEAQIKALEKDGFREAVYALARRKDQA